MVHRDLKPANILVSVDGRPTILDFGISKGEPVGGTVTAEGALIGTPGYLAPEQILGQRADVRSDLYAVGVLLFEALAGRAPHLGATPAMVMQARVLQVAPPLLRLAPHIPENIAEVIDRLLSPQPQHRPASAGEVLALLRGEQNFGTLELPWLGDKQVLDQAMDLARAGREVVVAGPPGSGRSRALREIAAGLAQDGEILHWMRPSRLPFGSLGPLRPRDELLQGLDLAEASAFVRSHVAQSATGAVVLADDWELIDRFTAQILLSLLPMLGLVRAMRGEIPQAISLVPLQEVVLRPLFRGQQRLFHVPEDAARLLHGRTGGLPRAVAAELQAWIRSGLATWQDGQVLVTRAAVDRLASAVPALGERDDAASSGAHDGDTTGQALMISTELAADPHLRELMAWLHLAWPRTTTKLLTEVVNMPRWQLQAGLAQLVLLGAVRLLPDGRHEPRGRAPGLGPWTADQLAHAHRALAHALPAGADRRLFHLVAAGQTGEVGAEAATVARALLHDGRLGEAEAVLLESLRVVRRDDGAPGEQPLLTLLVEVAWAARSVGALGVARYEVQRATGDLPELKSLTALIDVAFAASQSGGEAVLARANALPPLADDALDTLRQDIRKHAARTCPLVREEALDKDLAQWAMQRGTPAAEARLAAWRARLRYRQGRYPEAAALDQSAAKNAALPLYLRLTAMAYGASALQSAFEYDAAIELAAQSMALADAGRHVQATARAEQILRSTAYRAGGPMQPDVDLVRAVQEAGLPHLAVSVGFTEAVIAWRQGMWAQALPLVQTVREQAEMLAMQPYASVMPLLHALVDPTQSRPDPQKFSALAEAVGDPEVALQMYGLAALALAKGQPHWLAAAQTHAAGLGAAHLHHRLDLLSPAEALEAVQTGRVTGIARQYA